MDYLLSPRRLHPRAHATIAASMTTTGWCAAAATALVLLAAAAHAQDNQAVAASKRPNLLFMMADQLRWDAAR